MRKKFFSKKEICIIICTVIIPIILFFTSNFFNKLFKKYFPFLEFNLVGFELIGKYYALVFIIILCVFLYQNIINIRNYFIIKKAKKRGSNNFDTAIIIANNELFSLKNIFLSPYSYAFKQFFQLAKLKKIQYKIFDKLTVKEFDKIIKNPSIKNYYLFGHGSRHSFNLFEEKPIYYCKYSNEDLNKKYIAQYHCNHNFGKSLAEYVVKDEELLKRCDVTNEVRKPRDLKKQWREEIKKIKRSAKKC